MCASHDWTIGGIIASLHQNAKVRITPRESAHTNGGHCAHRAVLAWKHTLSRRVLMSRPPPPPPRRRARSPDPHPAPPPAPPRGAGGARSPFPRSPCSLGLPRECIPASLHRGKEVADAWIRAVYLPIMCRLRLLGLLPCGWPGSLARAPCRTTPHGEARSARIR